jgi:hypothetical protein
MERAMEDLTIEQMIAREVRRNWDPPWRVMARLIKTAISLVGLGAILYLADQAGPFLHLTQPTPSRYEELDSAQLIVRPGIGDFGIPVGALWECLERSPNTKSVTTERIGSGQFVAHVILKSLAMETLAMDLYFQVSNNTALLSAVKGVPAGPSFTQWNDIYGFVLGIA